MKKTILFCIAALSLAFTSCDKETPAETPATEYTLTITPAEVKIGEDLTFTIKGANVGDMHWTTCNKSGNCFAPNFVDGVASLPTDSFAAGEYEFYAECHEQGIKTNYAKVTIKE